MMVKSYKETSSMHHKYGADWYQELAADCYGMAVVPNTIFWQRDCEHWSAVARDKMGIRESDYDWEIMK